MFIDMHYIDNDAIAGHVPVAEVRTFEPRVDTGVEGVGNGVGLQTIGCYVTCSQC